MTPTLTPGALCYAHGNTYQIDGRCSPTEINARDCLSAEMVILKIKDLQAPPRTTKAEPLRVPAVQWERASALATDLFPWIAQHRLPPAELRRLTLKHDISARQLQRYRGRFEADPRATSLVPHKRGRGEGTRLLDDLRETIIAHAITKFYEIRERPPKEHVVRRVASLCRRLNVTPPGRKSVLARIKAREGYLSSRARLGAKAAKQKHEARTGGLTVQRPLELVQIDHTRVDVLVVSDDRLTVRGRPWITLAIDVATRCVVGYYLTMRAPSSVSVALCVEHMVLPKPENEGEPGLWPMFGKPTTILVDNGKDLRSQAFVTGCQQHGIEVRWRPVKTPHYGAHIERLNGTLMNLVHLLPGTTFSNSRQRGDYASEARATMTMDELNRWIVQKICRFYHVKSHKALKASPLYVWERLWQEHSEAGQGPTLVANPEAFRLDFLPRTFRVVKRSGIEHGASRYWHESLGPLVGRKEEVEIRFDPRHRQSIWVRDAAGGFIEAPAIAGRALPRTELTIAPMDTATRKRMEEVEDQGYDVCDAIEAEAASATRKARKGKAAPTSVTPEPRANVPAAKQVPLPAPEPAVRPASTRSFVAEIWE
jgi:putative transposase